MGSKYDPLTKHLIKVVDDDWRPTFADIEAVLGFQLPDSARQHPAWWANSDRVGRHAAAWLDAGWRAEELSLGGQRVVFRRGPMATAHPGVDELGCRLGMTWADQGHVTRADSGDLVFPALAAVPAIYRFSIRMLDGEESCYIGETNNLARRSREYLKPGKSQHTNIRLNKDFTTALAAGGEIKVAAVTCGAWLEVGGVRIEAALRSKSVRLLLENAAILSVSPDIKVLNLAD